MTAAVKLTELGSEYVVLQQQIQINLGVKYHFLRFFHPYKKEYLGTATSKKKKRRKKSLKTPSRIIDDR